jgi:hypothetical protein
MRSRNARGFGSWSKEKRMVKDSGSLRTIRDFLSGSPRESAYIEWRPDCPERGFSVTFGFGRRTIE